LSLKHVASIRGDRSDPDPFDEKQVEEQTGILALPKVRGGDRKSEKFQQNRI